MGRIVGPKILYGEGLMIVASAPELKLGHRRRRKSHKSNSQRNRNTPKHTARYMSSSHLLGPGSTLMASAAAMKVKIQVNVGECAGYLARMLKGRSGSTGLGTRKKSFQFTGRI